jgi:hypothetical protein
MLELYKVVDEQDVIRFFWAKSEDDAVARYKSYYFYGSPVASKVLTDQGYPMVRLRDVPNGTYFHRVSVKDGEFCEHSVVWCKGEYDHSSRKWFCHKFEDVNHSRLFKGEERVTIDFTF